MTVIVGLKTDKEVFLASDSAGSNSYVKDDYGSKLFIKKLKRSYQKPIDIAIGFTDCYRAGAVLGHIFEPPCWNLDTPLTTYLNSSFISALKQTFRENEVLLEKQNELPVGYNFLLAAAGRLFIVESNFAILEPQSGYASVGSGREYAIGALYATEGIKSHTMRLHTAVEAAMKYSPTCGGQTHILRIKNE